MRSLALVALALLLIAPEALARVVGVYPPFHGTVHVYDYTSAVWDGIIAETVADYNAVMPQGKDAPRFIYHRMPERTCGTLPKKRRANTIAVCSTQELLTYGWLHREIRLSDPLATGPW